MKPIPTGDAVTTEQREAEINRETERSKARVIPVPSPEPTRETDPVVARGGDQKILEQMQSTDGRKT